MYVICIIYIHTVGPFTYEPVGSAIFGEANDDWFGHSVSISADGITFVVGAPSNDGNGGLSGQVRVYQFSTTMGRYNQVGPDINGEAAGDQFGWAVSISADGLTFVVGAPFNDDNGDRSGHVRVYRWDSRSGLYTQLGSDISGAGPVDVFGYSVSISADGQTFLASAIYNDDNGISAGHVRVFKFNTTTAGFAQVGAAIKGKAPFDEFGYSLGISANGSTFVAGAPYNNDMDSDSGLVRVYKYTTSTGSYAQVGSDITGEAAYEYFGASVSMSADGSSFVAGATGNDGNGFNSGRVRVYNYNSTVDSYTQVGPVIKGKAAGDQFGWTVSMSADGASFVVGSPGNDDNGDFSGLVRAYKLNSTIGSYTQVGSDFKGEVADDQFGYSVSISPNGTNFVVGAPFNSSGNVRVYKFNSPKVPTQSPTKVPTKSPATVPTKSPTTASTKPPTTAPTKSPTTAPTRVPIIEPVSEPITIPTISSRAPMGPVTPDVPPTGSNCGLFGLNFFCPRRGECGFLRRLFGINGC